MWTPKSKTFNDFRAEICRNPWGLTEFEYHILTHWTQFWWFPSDSFIKSDSSSSLDWVSARIKSSSSPSRAVQRCGSRPKIHWASQSAKERSSMSAYFRLWTCACAACPVCEQTQRLELWTFGVTRAQSWSLFPVRLNQRSVVLCCYHITICVHFQAQTKY